MRMMQEQINDIKRLQERLNNAQKNEPPSFAAMEMITKGSLQAHANATKVMDTVTDKNLRDTLGKVLRGWEFSLHELEGVLAWAKKEGCIPVLHNRAGIARRPAGI